MKRFKNHIAEDLRKWFGKGKEGGAGGGDWDRYNSEGERVGKCGGADEGDAYAACLSKEKAQKLGKKGIASFVRRKRAAQKKGGDAKKGGEQSKGDKPIFVKTKANEDWSDKYKDSIDCDNPKGFSQKAHCAGRKKQNEGLRQAMSGPRETAAQKQKRQEKDNFDLYKKRQKRISALRGDPSSRKLTPKQQRDYLRRVNLDQIRAMEEVEIDEAKGTYSSMSRRGIEKPLMAFIADLEDELKKVGLKYSDRKVDPDDVMKAYNADMSPKDAAAMIKKKVK